MVVTTIRTAFNKKASELKLKDLNLLEGIDKTNPESERWTKIIEMFQDETLADAMLIIENMPPAIDSFIREEMASRPLKEIKATFLE